MNFLNLELNLADEPAFGRADGRQRGAWLSLMFHCVAIENEGVMLGAGAWSEREWLKTCSLSFEDLGIDEDEKVRESSPLWDWRGEDLHLLFYPHHHAARMEAMREGGKKGGRPRKADVVENPPLNPPLNHGLNHKVKESKVKEDKGKEEKGAAVAAGGSILAEDEQLEIAKRDLSSSGDSREPPPPAKKKEGGAGPLFPEDLAEGYRGPLVSWWEFKRERREGYKATGWAALVARERRFPVGQVRASVEASMANNWAGLFTDKVEGGSPSFVMAEKKEKGGGEPEWNWRGFAGEVLEMRSSLLPWAELLPRVREYVLIEWNKLNEEEQGPWLK